MKKKKKEKIYKNHVSPLHSPDLPRRSDYNPRACFKNHILTCLWVFSASECHRKQTEDRWCTHHLSLFLSVCRLHVKRKWQMKSCLVELLGCWKVTLITSWVFSSSRNRIGPKPGVTAHHATESRCELFGEEQRRGVEVLNDLQIAGPWPEKVIGFIKCLNVYHRSGGAFAGILHGCVLYLACICGKFSRFSSVSVRCTWVALHISRTSSSEDGWFFSAGVAYWKSERASAFLLHTQTHTHTVHACVGVDAL